MKTNHQRDFKDSQDRHSYRRKYVIGGNSVKSDLVDRIISAAAFLPEAEHVSAKKRARKAKAGAKKYVRTRLRFHENAETKKIAYQFC